MTKRYDNDNGNTNDNMTKSLRGQDSAPREGQEAAHRAGGREP